MTLALGYDPSLTHPALAWLHYPPDEGKPPKLLRVEVPKLKTGSTAADVFTALRTFETWGVWSDWSCVDIERREWSMPDVVVCESQQVYEKKTRQAKSRHGEGKVNPGVLIQLAHTSGVVAALCGAPDVAFPTPQEWKGNLDKAVYHEAVLLALGGEAEGWAWDVEGTAKHPRLVPRDPPVGGHLAGGAWENLLDAVGLTLWKMRGKKWRERVLALDQSPRSIERRTRREQAASLPDGDGLLRP